MCGRMHVCECQRKPKQAQSLTNWHSATNTTFNNQDHWTRTYLIAQVFLVEACGERADHNIERSPSPPVHHVHLTASSDQQPQHLTDLPVGCDVDGCSPIQVSAVKCKIIPVPADADLNKHPLIQPNIACNMIRFRANSLPLLYMCDKHHICACMTNTTSLYVQQSIATPIKLHLMTLFDS